MPFCYVDPTLDRIILYDGVGRCTGLHHFVFPLSNPLDIAHTEPQIQEKQLKIMYASES